MYSQLPISRQETSLQIMYGGGGVLNKVYTGSLRHDVQCPMPYHFNRKGTPFVYTFY